MLAHGSSGELDLENQKIVTEIEEKISAGLKQEAIDEIWDLKPERLYLLTQASSDIAELCESKEFNNKLLQSPHYEKIGELPDGEVQSIDKKIIVSPFHQLMGCYLTHAAREAKEPDISAKLLDKACEENSYHALNERMERMLEIEKTANVQSPIIDEILNQIQEDAEKMGNLYRALGFSQAGISLLHAAQIYFEHFDPEGIEIVREHYDDQLAKSKIQQLGKSKLNEELPKELKTINSLLEKSIEFLFLAYLSSQTKMSVALNKAINQGNALMVKETTWEEEEKFVKEDIPSFFRIRFPRHILEAAKKNADKQKKDYPDEYTRSFGSSRLKS